MEVAIVGCSLCLSLFSVLSILKCLGSLLVLIIVRLMDGSFFFSFVFWKFHVGPPYFLARSLGVM